MENLKLTQLSTSEYKLDAVVDFCLHSNGNFMTLVGSSAEFTIFELTYTCCSTVLMPYRNKQIPISQHKPISEVIKDIDLEEIYETASVQESQELALDPIYTADCTAEPLKAKVLQADITTLNNTSICCILTTYGHCEILKKEAITEQWILLNTNLSKILMIEVFPMHDLSSNIKSFNEFKTFVNKFIITCFAITTHDSDLIIYLGTAAGYIIALKYNDECCKFEQYCNLKTSLNRISYIVKDYNFILIGGDEGKVLLVKINFEKISLQELGYLWNKSDRMSCRKANFTYNEDSESYLVVFPKAAHLLAYSLDVEGNVLSSSSLYVRGIKITGIETLSRNEFIITTITCATTHIKIISTTKEEIFLQGQVIENDFDTLNYQILGLAVSPSKNLWSFLLYRNKDYVFRSKYVATTAFVNVCKLSGYDSFDKLINLNVKIMDMAQDLILGINLDIFNNMNANKYIEYFKLEHITFSNDINENFLQKLQLKIIITRKLALFQKTKFKKLKEQTKIELDILEPTLQLVHILRRLRFLREQSLKGLKFSKFQLLSIACMQVQFNHLISDIRTIIGHKEYKTIRSIVGKFLEFFERELAKNKFDTSRFGEIIEYCTVCNQAATNFRKCDQQHDIKRCSISSTQLSLFNTKYCPHCYAMARNDDAANLKELYETDDCITCIYCRFLLTHDAF